MKNKKKMQVGVEFKSGLVVYFSGSKEVLGGFIDLLAMGLKPEKTTVKIKK